MDLSVYSLPKITKEKRERQPNWTEPEKQLLLSLTRIHQSILENKGSDTMTIKRKSQAWDEISLHMRAAGYNRSKERLKQQLGRIRAAKRAKEALEKSVLSSTSNLFKENISLVGKHTNPIDTQEEIHIKVEKITPVDKEEYEDISDPRSCPQTDEGNNSKCMEDNVIHFMLKNVQSLNGTGNCSNTFHESHNMCDESQANENVSSNICLANNATNQVITNACSSTNVQANDNKNVKSCILNVQHERRLASTRSKRDQRLRQIHMYRIAVERERLRGLKLQQKRDRILHRKDVKIQNLKLQILQNITNQNRDGNCINF